MKYLLLLFICITHIVKAEVSHSVLEECKNDIFVSTGVQGSISIVNALQSPFEYVYCIEEDRMLAEHARLTIPIYFFPSTPKYVKNYHIYQGSPASSLIHVIFSLNKPITFLLGSHLPERDHPEKKNSLLQELEQIKQHPIKSHTILIDYIHWAGTPYFDNINLSTIIEKLIEINPNYQFKFAKGGYFASEDNAILIAYLK